MMPVNLARPGMLALALAIPVTASAQYYLPAGEVVHERIFEIQPLVGWFVPDGNTSYPDGSPLAGLRGTLNNSESWAFEGHLAWAFRQKQVVPTGRVESYTAQPVYNAGGFPVGVVINNLETSSRELATGSDLLSFGGSMLLHLSDRKLRPFVSLGGGYLWDFSNTDATPPSAFSGLFGEFGGGVKYMRSDGASIRVDVRDMVMRPDDLPRDDPDASLIAAQFDWSTGGGLDGVPGREPFSPVEFRGKRWTHNLALTVSVSVPFGWAWKDGDGDGVATRFDDCPTTAPSVVVDAKGCGIDSDADGVFDGLDECSDTPTGAKVDRLGCPSDIDGDGVLDGIDQDDNTPAGAVVDDLGRHSDTDADGVLDGIDQCTDTPAGATVDSRGCSVDPVEDALLRGQPILVENVRFEGGSAEIVPTSYRSLNRVARLVETWTGNRERPRRIEVGVHGTRGEPADLVQRRANRIRLYFLENFFEMGANNLVAKGYSPEEGAGDGRVEVRVVGEGDPPQEYDFGESEGHSPLLPGLLPGADPLAPPPAGGDAAPEPDRPGAPSVPDVPEPEMPEPEMPEPEMPDPGLPPE